MDNNRELELILEEPHSRALNSILELRSYLGAEIGSKQLVLEYFEIHKNHGWSVQFTPEDAFYVLFNRYREKIGENFG